MPSNRTKLETLFENLGERLKNENNLSDILYSFCQISEEFQKECLTFFFYDNDNHKDNDKSKKLDYDWENIFLEREYKKGNSRVDFYIELYPKKDNNKSDDNKKYKKFVIEIKLDDTNYHEIKYKKEIRPDQIAIIANTKPELKNKKDIITKTWRDFYDYMQEKIEEGDLQDKELFQAFLAYIEEVTNIKPYRKMDLYSLTNLENFRRLIEDIIKNYENEKYVLELPDRDDSDLDYNKYGRYFKVLKEENNEELYGLWFGVYFDNKKVEVYLEVNEKWGGDLFEKFEDYDENKKRVSFYWYYDGKLDIYAIALKEKKFNEFNEAKTVKNQKEILEEFFNEAMDFIFEVYES